MGRVRFDDQDDLRRVCRRTSTRRPWPALGLVALLLVSLGCGGGSVQQGPSDALRAYSRALEEGRVDEAYRMLSDEAKRSMSLEAFRRAVRESPDDVREIAKALSRPTSDPEILATVSLPNGDELDMVYEDGRWRIDAATVDLYSQATPRQALVGFVRAFERKRYDIVLRYVPDAEKEGLDDASLAAKEPEDGPTLPSDAPAKPGNGTPEPSPDPAEATPAVPDDGRLTAEKLQAAWEGPQKEEMERIVQAIKAALPTARIEETGDNASMSYGAGGTVAFLREHGVWKIKDF